MKKTVTSIRCVPRLGLHGTQLRLIDIDVIDTDDMQELLSAANRWFAIHGIAEAVFDVDFDNEGPLLIVNDEVFTKQWGELLN